MFIQSISILSDIFNHHCILSDIFYWILHYMEWDVVIVFLDEVWLVWIT